jgi:hypothetical protein
MGPPRVLPSNKLTKNRIKNTTNKTFAIPAASTAIPPKPKMAATSAITKNTAAQYNMALSSNGFGCKITAQGHNVSHWPLD